MALNHQWCVLKLSCCTFATNPPLPAAFTTKGATHDHKSHLWNVLIMWVVQRKTICLITSNWFGLTVKASVCSLVNCTVSCHWAVKRSNFSDVQLSQLTAKAKASWMRLNLREAKHWASYQLTLSAKALGDLSVAQSELKVTFWRDRERKEKGNRDAGHATMCLGFVCVMYIERRPLLRNIFSKHPLNWKWIWDFTNALRNHCYWFAKDDKWNLKIWIKHPDAVLYFR